MSPSRWVFEPAVAAPLLVGHTAEASFYDPLLEQIKDFCYNVANPNVQEEVPDYDVLERDGYLNGVASWYGPGFHLRQTANGEEYDQEGFTAAHPILPMNTLVEVENMVNGRKVVIRVNDRGPYASDNGKPRIIDLSHGAAKSLAMVQAGVQPVNLRVLRWPANVDRQLGIAAYKQYVVALGSFDRRDWADRYCNAIKDKCPWAEVQVDKEPGVDTWCVVTPPAMDELLCRQMAERFRQDGLRPFVRRMRK